VYLRQPEEARTLDNYRGAGINLARSGDFERAVPLLRKGVELDPEGAHGHFALASALVQWAEPEALVRGSAKSNDLLREAVDHARRATELKPDHVQAYFMWGRSLQYLRDQEAAIAPLSQGALLNPADFNLQFCLAEAFLATGKTAEAEMHFENARRLDPDNPLPVEHLQRIRQKQK
jgi:tetratricopeptide (TPR) repeat protein